MGITTHDPDPAPLAPGECVEVFAAVSRAPVTGSDAIAELDAPNATGFFPLTHRFSRRRFRGIFTQPESVMLVSHSRCGCGFGFGLPDSHDEQIIEAFLRADPDRQLAAQNDVDDMILWIRRMLETTPLVEILIATNEPTRPKPARVIEISPNDLRGAARTFRVGDLIRISAYAHA